jgi:hypothetical protein
VKKCSGSIFDLAGTPEGISIHRGELPVGILFFNSACERDTEGSAVRRLEDSPFNRLMTSRNGGDGGVEREQELRIVLEFCHFCDGFGEDTPCKLFVDNGRCEHSIAVLNELDLHGDCKARCVLNVCVVIESG